MKLPVKMSAIVEQTLKKSFPDQKFLFKTIYIKGLLDENNVETLEIMKPRFVHIYGVDEAEVNKATFLCKKLLGDAFSFEVSEGYALPEESEEVSISLHERSRILSAVDFCRVFEKQSVEENIQYMLKSTILLTVNRYVLKGSPDAYTCDLNIRPTIARLTPPDQGRIAFSSPYTAIETSLNTDEYETLVDKYFDSVAIAFNDKQTEFVAPDTTMELLNVAKKIVLGENYLDEFEVIKEH
jgi:hypothetical protein